MLEQQLEGYKLSLKEKQTTNNQRAIENSFDTFHVGKYCSLPKGYTTAQRHHSVFIDQFRQCSSK